LAIANSTIVVVIALTVTKVHLLSFTIALVVIVAATTIAELA
jgi:hypothetical protein